MMNAKIDRDSIEAIKNDREAINILRNICGKDKKNGFICPSCGSGSGIKGTGVSYYSKGNSYYCFACGKNDSAIGWYMAATKKNFAEAVREMSDLLGINIK